MIERPADRLVERFGREGPRLVSRVLSELEVLDPGGFGSLGPAVVRNGLETITRLLVRCLSGDQAAALGESKEVAELIGRGTAAAGVPLDALMSSLRLYPQHAWSVLAELARDAHLSGDEVMELALASLAFADEVARLAIAEHVSASAHRDAARLLARERLLAALLTGTVDSASLPARAEGCGWHLPARARVAVAFGSRPDWAGSALSGRWAEQLVAIYPAGEPAKSIAAFGPELTIAELPESLALAQRILDVVGRRQQPPSEPALWEDSVDALVITADRRSARWLADEALAALDAAPARQRAWLAPTLSAWLDHPRQPTRIAATLNLHPQSVRYRLGILRDLLGDQLDDAGQRARMRLALQIRDLEGLAPPNERRDGL